MRLARFRAGDRIATGVLEGQFARPLRGTFFEDPVPTGEEIPLETVRLLAPVIPSKVVCVGRNYADHAAELGNVIPAEPLLFLKPSTSVIGPADVIPLPEVSERVDHEAELAMVIGRLCRGVAQEEAARYILGYACGNDVTARERARCAIDRTVQNSDFWIEPTDFFKLRYFSLTYDLPANLIRGLGAASVTFAGRNLFSVTDYSGLDPESADLSDNTFARREYYQLPALRSFTLSLRTRF